MPNTDRVTIQHPALDGTFTVSRRAFPSRAKRGWVEVTTSSAAPVSRPKSPAPAVEAPNTSPEDEINPSQED